MKALMLLWLAAGLLCAGCSSWRDSMTMSFVNVNNEVVVVEYANEARETTLYRDDGTPIPYKSKYKVRVTFPSGKRFVAYDVPSVQGTRYRSSNGEWEFLSFGYACKIFAIDEEEGADLLFDGMVCAQRGAGGGGVASKRAGERVFNSPREHGNTANVKKTQSGKASK